MTDIRVEVQQAKKRIFGRVRVRSVLLVAAAALLIWTPSRRMISSSTCIIGANVRQIPAEDKERLFSLRTAMIQSPWVFHVSESCTHSFQKALTRMSDPEDRSHWLMVGLIHMPAKYPEHAVWEQKLWADVNAATSPDAQQALLTTIIDHGSAYYEKPLQPFEEQQRKDIVGKAKALLASQGPQP